MTSDGPAFNLSALLASQRSELPAELTRRVHPGVLASEVDDAFTRRERRELAKALLAVWPSTSPYSPSAFGAAQVYERRNSGWLVDSDARTAHLAALRKVSETSPELQELLRRAEQIASGLWRTKTVRLRWWSPVQEWVALAVVESNPLLWEDAHTGRIFWTAAVNEALCTMDRVSDTGVQNLDTASPRFRVASGERRAAQQVMSAVQRPALRWIPSIVVVVAVIMVVVTVLSGHLVLATYAAPGLVSMLAMFASQSRDRHPRWVYGDPRRQRDGTLPGDRRRSVTRAVNEFLEQHAEGAWTTSPEAPLPPQPSTNLTALDAAPEPGTFLGADGVFDTFNAVAADALGRGASSGSSRTPPRRVPIAPGEDRGRPASGDGFKTPPPNDPLYAGAPTEWDRAADLWKRTGELLEGREVPSQDQPARGRPEPQHGVGLAARAAAIRGGLADLDQEWLRYLVNTEELFLTMPRLRDDDWPPTKAYREAMADLGEAVETLDSQLDEAFVSAGEAALHAAEDAWHDARIAAADAADASLPPREQRALRRAANHITVLENPNLPRAMRDERLRQLRAELDRLETVPISFEQVMEMPKLETVRRLALEAAPTSDKKGAPNDIED
ncbi:Uncharacterised protein (plasmid) [Tsukamurella tyrosinosolvens]|uniref:Uncharacterized protein n=1 Tax=Tsukamurella tyrosinosolvens TaxID=57704 RepID=A0A1H4U552_TSUTY|nr:hypothetical protein [Tsukamurella tyrosinosolvens]KXO93020.1 hypothetical protein AXK58_14210 [Tsukamurella tyrosinosolvens]SEC63849.1 hypothetical protein SAMN04489793_2788 [Tsukamurella tyrosinosolvens]VEH94004.1 Uncharacterised protein [Tsukamurella tyrosinosolvens]